MPLAILNDKLWFPPVQNALDDGLLAMGGDLTIERLKLAYSQGIFPWYDDDLPLWWCPNPRFVLMPNDLKVSKSMQQLFSKNAFKVTTNQAFKQVILACKTTKRHNQQGSWLNMHMVNAYYNLHIQGIAHSVEVWQNETLVGGLYGIKMGKVFFGESMFSHQSNASKYGFIYYVQQLIKEGIELIDCQIHSPHLESLGAKMMEREVFLQKLKQLL